MTYASSFRFDNFFPGIDEIPSLFIPCENLMAFVPFPWKNLLTRWTRQPRNIKRQNRHKPHNRNAQPKILQLEDRIVPAPVASIVGLTAAGVNQPLIGETVSYNFNFTNGSGVDVGYAPFIEVAVDRTGDSPPAVGNSLNSPNDGFALPTVTAAGLSLSPAATVTLSAANITAGTYTNPFTGDSRAIPGTAKFNAGDQVLVYALPFGSFTPGQTTAVTMSLPISTFADVNNPLPLAVTGGFRADNPALTGPRFYGTSQLSDATPQLYRLNKIYLGPESETATGPNYVRRYRLEVDIAAGQNVTNLRITDDLAASMQIVGKNTTNMAAYLFSGGVQGANSFALASLTGSALTTAPDGTLIYTFASVTGAAGVDAAYEFDFYIPRDDSASNQVVPQTPLALPVTGTDSTTAVNNAGSLLNWVPLDPLDSPATNLPPSSSGSTLAHTLEQQSIAVQKSVVAIDPTTGNVIPTGQPIQPGKTLLRYTINFQVSDYYAIQNVFLNDTIGDGLRLFTGTRGVVTAGIPTLTVNNAYLKGAVAGNRTDLATGAFNGATIDYQRRYTLQSTLPAGASTDPTSFAGTGPTATAFSTPTTGATVDGTTLLRFNISNELIRQLGASAGLLVGGEINNNGSGPDNDPFARPRLGAATGAIVYYVEVSEDFSDNFPSVDRSVDQGDRLNNSVDDTQTGGRDGIVGTQIRPSTINDAVPTTIGTGTDDSGATVSIPYGVQSKTIARINGQAVPVQSATNPPFSVQAGDRITYKLTYTLPISSYEQLTIKDIPPLPVMAVGAASLYDFQTGAPTFGNYTAAIAPDDTYFSTLGIVSASNLVAATTGALAGAAYNPVGGAASNGAFTGAPSSIDGVALANGNLVLVKDQADPRQNGVYLVVNAATGAWSRSVDMDAVREVQNTLLFRIAGGAVNANRAFSQTNNKFLSFNNATPANGNIVFTSFITTDPVTNTIAFNFGNFDDNGQRRSTTISILLTLPVGADPFASDLFLTNQLRIDEGSTNQGSVTVEDLRRFELVRPQLAVQKGAVAGDGVGLTAGSGASQVVFAPATNAAGTFTLGGAVLSNLNTVDDATEAGNIGGLNVTLTNAPVDAGDKVRFAIVARNSGKGDAFNVTLTDVIQPGFDLASFTNLRLLRGDGSVLSLGTDYTFTYSNGTGALAITLIDNYVAGNVGGAAEDNRTGALSRGLRTDQTTGNVTISNGSNTVVALYDVTLANNVAPNRTITNTARITNYATVVGGPNLTDPLVVPGATQPTDTATVVTKLPLVSKTLVGTEVTNTGNTSSQAVIGELATYTVTLAIPEGLTAGATLVDTMSAGLAFVDVTLVTSTAGLAFSGTGGLPTLSATPANTVITPVGTGNVITFNLGDITNSNTVNATVETITITYRVVVLNTLANQRDQTRSNSARFAWTSNATTVAAVNAGQTTGAAGTASGTSTPITIVEPTLTNTKDVRNVTNSGTFGQTTRGDNGDVMQYRIVIANGSAATDTVAYDVSLSDTIPSLVTSPALVALGITSSGSISFNGTTRAVLPTDFVINAGVLTFDPSINVDMQPGSSITVTVQGTFTGASGLTIVNTADVRWTSLDGAPGTRSTHNVASTERGGQDGALNTQTAPNFLNDYRVVDTADITSPPLVRKTIVASSEPGTTPTAAHPVNGGLTDRLAIGEVVRQRLYVSLAEGLTRNFQVQDFIPTGMQFLNDGSARFAFLSTTGGQISSIGITNISSLGTGGAGNLDSGAVTLLSLPSSSVAGTFNDNNLANAAAGAGTGEASLFASAQSVFFRFGDLNNVDSDVDDEFVVIEYNALVPNVVGNQAGNSLTNNFGVLVDIDNNGAPGYVGVLQDTDGSGTFSAGDTASNANDPGNNGAGTPGLSNNTVATIVEPNVTVTKAVTATNGSVVTYRVIIFNTGANASQANNTRLIDVLPAADLTLLNPTGLTASLAGGATGAVNNSTGNTVDFTIASIPVGGSVTLDYQATVLTVPTGITTINNTVNIASTSLSGTNGTLPFFNTVVGTLGAPGTPTGERTGADGVGGLNDYVDSASQKLGSLGDRVYVDINGNGVQDGANEPGIVGAAVTVLWAGQDGTFNTVDDSLINATTGANGIYTVTGLPVDSPGAFRVTVNGAAAPFTTFGLNTLTDSINNGGAPSPVNPTTLSLTTAIPNPRDQDFGYRGTATLGNFVWHDVDADGVQDAGEPGIPAVNVQLTWLGQDNTLGGGDDVVLTTTTNAAGGYSFANLPAGNYKVDVLTATLPDNFTPTFDLDGVATVANSTLTTLTTGQNRTDVDFGYTGNATIGDTVWYDVDGNGVQNNAEPGIAGVTVTLLFGGDDGDLATAADNITYTTTTNSAGNYQFPNLFGGDISGANPNYRVTVTTPTGYPTQTFDSDGTGTANQSSLQLANNGSNQLQDFGYRGPATQGLGDFVWEDLNGNGRQDGEPGLVGVTVQLLDASNNVLATTLTVVGGIYSFPNLAASSVAGNYKVNVVAPVGYVFTAQNSAVANINTNSNVDATGITGAITLPANTIDNSIDAGLYRLVTLGDRVFFDTDADGVQDGVNEPGISGVPITVVWLGLDGAVGGGDDQTFNTTTGVNGAWSVANLRPGNFVVTAAPTAASGFNTLTDSLDNGVLNATNPVAVSTNSGVNRADIDFGYRGTATLGNFVWHDVDADGVQDAGEPGIPGLPVQLTWLGQDNTLGGGDDIVLNTTTGANGAYSFTNLPAGSYQVTVDTAGSNLTPTFDLDGTATPNVAVATLTTGQNRTDVDFGLVGNASVGDRVFIDQDGDGVQDAAEPGIPGATVQLVASGVDGVLGTADDMTFNTTTGANGLYLFTGLPVFGGSDSYRADVTSLPIAGLNPTVDLDGIATANTATFTVTDSGVNQNRRDVDFGYDGLSTIAGTVYRDDDNNGLQTGAEPGIAGVVVTLIGVDPFGNPVLDPATNLPYVTTTDANGNYAFATVIPGTYHIDETQPAAYNDGLDTAGNFGAGTNGVAGNDTITNIVVGANVDGVEYNFGERGAFLSGTVFRDDNRDGTQNAGEPGIAVVTVELLDSLGNVVATTTTDGDGNYRFDNIPAGSYTVRETQPAGYANSPVGPATIRAVTLPLAGLANQNFGETLGSLSGAVYVDFNNNGVRNVGEPGISGAKVTLAGIDANGNPVARTTFADANGSYRFDQLLAGTYAVTETQPVAFIDGLDSLGAINGLGNGTATNDQFSNIALPAGAAGLGYNFGELPPAGNYAKNTFVSGTVYVDANANGVLDQGEAPIGGVTVQLLNLNGTPARSFLPNQAPGTPPAGPIIPAVVTNPDGTYLFPVVPPGTYIVRETQPAGYASTTPNDRVITVPASLTPVTNVNFGEILGVISGSVYLDLNNDGARQTTETGIPGVVVTLTGNDVSGNPVSRTTTTDANGRFTFTNLPQSDAAGYTLNEPTQPAPYLDGLETAGSLNGSTATNEFISGIVLPAGGTSTDNLFGETIATPAAGTTFVSGTVWRDLDRDGVLDPNEPGLPGVTVQLVNDLGNVVASTTTGPGGSYLFNNVPPGTYTVVETQPSVYGSSTPNTVPIFVPPSLVPVTGVNFGETTGSLSGSVYNDFNNNGTRDPGEPGIAGVTVTLTGTDLNSNPVNRVGVTDGNGDYLFLDLPAGTYTVTESQPSNYADGLDALGSASGVLGNDQASAIPLGAGVQASRYDFGEVGPNSVSGFVYGDVNMNGVRNAGGPDIAIANVLVTLVSADGLITRSTRTDASGFYRFDDLPSGTYRITENQLSVPTSAFNFPTRGVYDGADNIGGGTFTPGTNPAKNVLLAVLGSNDGQAENGVNFNFGELPPADPFGSVYVDFNNNGRRDAGEPGIRGVPIRISGTAFAGTPFARPLVAADVPGGLTHLTDANGRYEFNPMPPGLYSIVEVTQPAGYADGREQNGDPNGAQGVIVGNDRFDNLRLAPNPVRGPLNFGELAFNSSIAGSVYVDRNGDGRRGSGELGIPGVTVFVTGVDVGGRRVAARVVTDARGNFLFRKMAAGTYQLREVHPVLYVDGLDRAGTAGGRAGNDVVNGIALRANQAATTYLFGERGLNPRVVTKRQFLASSNGIIGRAGTGVVRVNNLGDPIGYVYVDANANGRRDAGEKGIPGILVELTGKLLDGGAYLKQLRTDANGFYRFDFLPTGTYAVRQVEQPAGYRDGREQLGTLGGVVANDLIHSIFVGPEDMGVDYNFGELPATPQAAAAPMPVVAAPATATPVATISAPLPTTASLLISSFASSVPAALIEPAKLLAAVQERDPRTMAQIDFALLALLEAKGTNLPLADLSHDLVDQVFGELTPEVA